MPSRYTGRGQRVSGATRGAARGPVEQLEPRQLLSAVSVGPSGPSYLSRPRAHVSDGTAAYYYTKPNSETADIWRTDGTAAGTRRLGSVPDSGWVHPDHFTL